MSSTSGLVRRAFGFVVVSAVFVSGALGSGCGSNVEANAQASAQTACAAYQSGVSTCGGGAFDSAKCQKDLTCIFGAYRSEVSAFFSGCADRFKSGQCPMRSDYLCEQDKAALAMIKPTAKGTEFLSAFEVKGSMCSASGVTLQAGLASSAAYVRDEILTELSACLSMACSEVNACLSAATMRTAPSCS